MVQTSLVLHPHARVHLHSAQVRSSLSSGMHLYLRPHARAARLLNT
jgi:hypothetical protein